MAELHLGNTCSVRFLPGSDLDCGSEGQLGCPLVRGDFHNAR